MILASIANILFTMFMAVFGSLQADLCIKLSIAMVITHFDPPDIIYMENYISQTT